MAEQLAETLVATPTKADLIERINRDGLSILLVEQNVVQSLAIAHRGYVLENGTIALTGRASELVDNPSLKRSYLGI